MEPVSPKTSKCGFRHGVANIPKSCPLQGTFCSHTNKARTIHTDITALLLPRRAMGSSCSTVSGVDFCMDCKPERITIAN
eukprot:357598-Chlamydomonas_euryale.AAC.2